MYPFQIALQKHKNEHSCTFNVLKSSLGDHFWGDGEDRDLALSQSLLEIVEAAAMGKKIWKDLRISSKRRLPRSTEQRQMPRNLWKEVAKRTCWSHGVLRRKSPWAPQGSVPSISVKELPLGEAWGCHLRRPILEPSLQQNGPSTFLFWISTPWRWPTTRRP